jgi:hypothetical protein
MVPFMLFGDALKSLMLVAQCVCAKWCEDELPVLFWPCKFRWTLLVREADAARRGDGHAPFAP